MNIDRLFILISHSLLYTKTKLVNDIQQISNLESKLNPNLTHVQ